jgi:hypothetical protein
MDVPQSLVRIAKVPQNVGPSVKAALLRVFLVDYSMGAVLLRVVEGSTLLYVGARRNHLSHKE